MKRSRKKKASKTIGVVGCYFFFELLTFMFLATKHPEILKNPASLLE